MKRLVRLALVVLLALTGLLTVGSVAARADNAPPVLASFSLSPTSVDVSSASATVTANAHITDSDGLYNGYVYLYSPDGKYTRSTYFNNSYYYNSYRTSGSSQDGTYSIPVVIPQYSERGTWTAQVYLVDYAYNSTRLTPNATVSVAASQQDTTGPLIESIAYSPAVIDTSSRDVTVTATAHVTDDLSGFSNGVFSLTSPNSATVLRVYAYAYNRTSGTAQDGYYQVQFTFPQYSQQGNWTSSASLNDVIGNSALVRPSATVAVGVSSVPGPPTAVTASPGSRSATVSWTAPSTGASPTSYTIVANPGGQTTTITGNPPTTSAVVSGLTNGTDYTFTVSAANGSGVGPVSSSSAPVTPLTVPGSPISVQANAGDTSASVTWTAPGDGGSPITSYTVSASPGGASTTVTGSPAPTQASVTGLTNGTAYSFTVVATNAAGDGPASAASSPVTPTGAPPGAPQAVQGLAGPFAGQATVFWTPPVTAGSTSVTGYKIYRSVGSAGAQLVGSTAALRFTDAALTPDTLYTYTVTAVNSSGQGSPGVPVQLAPELGPTLVASDTSVIEPPVGQTKTATFTVSASGNFTDPVTVHYATTDGTAVAGRDYTAASGDLTLSPANGNRASVSVTVSGTGLHDDGLSFGLTLSDPTGAATLPDATATASIVNRLGLVPVSVGSAYVQKASASRQIQVPVSIASAPASGEQVQVTLRTANGTAASPKDYSPVTQVLTFTSSSPTTQLVPVTVTGGRVKGANKTFRAVLSAPSASAEIAAGTGIETIVNKGGTPAPSLAEGDLTTLEATGQQVVLVPVTLSAATNKPVTVDYRTVDGTRAAGSGYQPSSGTVTIPADQTATSVPITVLHGLGRSGPQSFTVQFSSPTNAQLPDAAATITVIDPDGPYRIRVAEGELARPAYGPDDFLLFNVGVGIPVAGDAPVTLHYETADGTAIAARGDYRPVSGDITIPAGQGGATVRVPIPSGATILPEQTFQLLLSAPSANAVLADPDATGRITGVGPIPPGSWQAQSSGTTAKLRAVTFTDPTHGWATGDGGTILVTTDAGAHWAAQSSGTTNALLAIAFSGPEVGYAVGAAGTIVHTIDGGATWKAQTSGTSNQLNGLSLVSKTQGWATGVKGTLITTSDGGAHWTAQQPSTGSTDLRDPDFLSGAVGFAVGGQLTGVDTGVIIGTTDGGVSWHTIVSNAHGQLSGIEMADATHGTAVGDRGTLLTTTDGTNWVARSSPAGTTLLADVSAVDVDRSSVVGDKGTILTTVDEGQTYVAQSSGTTLPLRDVAFVDPWHGWAVGDSGTILTFGS